MKYKYIVTVNHGGNKVVRSNSLKESEKTQIKLARQYKNLQVDLYEDVNEDEWKHLSMVSVCSFT